MIVGNRRNREGLRRRESHTEPRRRSLRMEWLEDRRLLSMGDLLQTFTGPGTTVPTFAFGWAVAADKGLVVVADSSANVNGYRDAGCVYVLNAASGELVSTLKNPAPDEYNQFGSSVAISGSTVVVGAYDDNTEASASGMAYVFDAANGKLVATLNNPSPTIGCYFGNSVSISGNTVVVGAYGDSTATDSSGMAYVFDAVSGAFLATLANPTPTLWNGLGYCVAISDEKAVIASPGEAAYVFDVNRPPVAGAGGPYSVIEGSSVTLTAAGSSDPDVGDALAYAWDLDHNGTYETAGMTPQFSAAGLVGPASVTVGLQVTDSHGATSTDTATVNIVAKPSQVDRVIHDAGRAQTDDDQQRSTITRLQVVFTGLIDGFANGAFTLTKDGDGAVALQAPVKQTVGGVSVVTLTFNASAATYRRGSGYALNDGTYTLVVDGSKIQSAGSVTGATDHFYRLFGDSDGDRDVDTVDHLAILKALTGLGSTPAFNAAMDYDGSGTVDPADYLQFLRRLGRRI